MGNHRWGSFCPGESGRKKRLKKLRGSTPAAKQMVRRHPLRPSRAQSRRALMPTKKKTKAVLVDGIPIKPISPAEHRRLDRRIKKKHEKLRRRNPEVHGKKVDGISHWHEEGYLSFNVRFTDGKNFSILCSPTIVTNVVDFSDVKTG